MSAGRRQEGKIVARAEVIAIGELLVEIMRKRVDSPLDRPDDFVGPFPSGAPAIFADQMARLGHSVAFVGAVGRDDFGKCLLDRFATDGVDTSYVTQIDGVATGVAFVTYFSDGRRQFIFHIGNAAAGQMIVADADLFAGARWLHICGSSLSAGEKMREACYEAVRLAEGAGCLIAFDPNLRPELLGGEEALRQICAPILDVATLVLPSGAEAQVLTGTSDPETACQALLERGVQYVALKRGAAGCTIFTADEVVPVPGFSVDAVDPSGAGDCFDAGFVVGLIEQLPLEEVGRLANACGALAATAMGPMEGAAWRSEVDSFIGRRQ